MFIVGYSFDVEIIEFGGRGEVVGYFYFFLEFFWFVEGIVRYSFSKIFCWCNGGKLNRSLVEMELVDRVVGWFGGSLVGGWGCDCNFKY